MRNFILIILIALVIGCKNEGEVITPNPIENEVEIYFPPVGQDQWETVDPGSLGWDLPAIDGLDQFMIESKSRALIVLKHGKIAIEKYAGESLAGQPFTEKSHWYWASAAKTLTASLTGIGAQEGYIDLEASSSDYLGHQWSTMTEDQEDAVKVIHHLTMTTGLETPLLNLDCTDAECLAYRTEPGSRWFYHNAPYTILDQIIVGASGKEFNVYFNSKIRNPIGMDGFWIYGGYNHLYFSSPRSMARFGIMIQNEGKWNDQQILDADFVKDMTTSSQTLNESYGYLWWLNGQESYILPGLATPFNGSIIPEAPQNSFAAMGKNGQILHIAPDEGLIIVRMGDNPDESFVPMQFFRDLWSQINLIIDPN